LWDSERFCRFKIVKRQTVTTSLNLIVMSASLSNSQSLSGRGVIVGKDEIDRMRRSILPPTENFAREQKAEHLKKLSNDRVKNWPNTLEALRKKKESYLKEKEDIEEQKRQEVDREEAELRRKTRLDAIERANTMIYEQTDRMKYLRSQELLSDVVHTRGYQLVEKDQRAKSEQSAERKHHEDTIRQVQQGEEEERKKRELQKKKLSEVSISRKMQLDEVASRRNAQLEEERRIGEAMKLEAQLQLERDNQARKEKQRHIAESNLNMAKANAQLKQMRDEYQALEEEENRRRDEEVEVIDNRKKVRKALEKRKFDKAQVTRQQIIDAATKALTDQSSKETAILEKQATELRQKEDNALAAKESRREQEWNAIVKSRADQIQHRRDAAAQEKQENEVLIKEWMDQAAKGIEKEKTKLVRQRQETISVKNDLYTVAQLKARQKIEAQLIEAEREKVLRADEQADDEKFRDICLKEISRYKADGKPLIPLYRALEHKPPDLMAVTGFRL
jgi:hypothetical protein